VKFSVFMMPLHRPGDSPSLAFARDIGLIEYADELGFDEFLIGEHHSGGWETMPAPEMALAMAAAKAHRIRLGTSVISAPFHHPFQVAERMAFLDHLTRGRAIMGIGPCSLVTDMKLFGTPREDLSAMMQEAVEVIVRLLEEDGPVSHEGRFWSFRDMRLQLQSYQRPRLPLALASTGSPATLRLAGKHDMILLTNAGGGMRRRSPLADLWKGYEAGAAEAGRTANRDNWRVVTAMHLAETREQAWAEATAGLMVETDYFCTVGLKPVYETYPDQPQSEFTPDSVVAARDWIVGTPDDAIAWIEKHVAETGGFGGVMITAHEWCDPAATRRSLELFARYVMPHFRGHTRAMHDEWRAFREQVADGGVKIAPEAAGNLTTRRTAS
jgi:limonene 1,2-monooxygenase